MDDNRLHRMVLSRPKEKLTISDCVHHLICVRSDPHLRIIILRNPKLEPSPDLDQLL